MSRLVSKPEFDYPLGNLSDWNRCGHIAAQFPPTFMKK